MIRAGLLGLGVGACLVAGCQSDRPEPGAIAKEWSTNTSQLGIRPIYPPREVYPGDLWVSVGFGVDDVSQIPTSAYRILPIRYTHLDLSALAAKEAKGRDKFPIDSPVGEAVELKAYPDDANRTNCMVAFPGFSFASTSDIDLGANIPTGGWGGIFSTSSKSRYTVSYSVARSECLSHEVRYVMPEAARYLLNMESYDLDNMAVTARMLRIPKEFKEKYDAHPIIVIPYEVYYARDIDVTITSLDGSSSQLSATLLAFTELNERKQNIEEQIRQLAGKADSSSGAGSGSSGGTGGAQDPTANPPAATNGQPPAEQANQAGAPNKGQTDQQSQDQIAALQSQLASVQQQLDTASKALMPTVPGATGNITRISSTGVTLHQKFSVPVAIGYRSIQFELPRRRVASAAQNAQTNPNGPDIVVGATNYEQIPYILKPETSWFSRLMLSMFSGSLSKRPTTTETTPPTTSTAQNSVPTTPNVLRTSTLQP